MAGFHPIQAQKPGSTWPGGTSKINDLVIAGAYLGPTIDDQLLLLLDMSC